MAYRRGSIFYIDNDEQTGLEIVPLGYKIINQDTKKEYIVERTIEPDTTLLQALSVGYIKRTEADAALATDQPVVNTFSTVTEGMPATFTIENFNVGTIYTCKLGELSNIVAPDENGIFTVIAPELGEGVLSQDFEWRVYAQAPGKQMSVPLYGSITINDLNVVMGASTNIQDVEENTSYQFQITSYEPTYAYRLELNGASQAVTPDENGLFTIVAPEVSVETPIDWTLYTTPVNLSEEIVTTGVVDIQDKPKVNVNTVQVTEGQDVLITVVDYNASYNYVWAIEGSVVVAEHIGSGVFKMPITEVAIDTIFDISVYATSTGAGDSLVTVVTQTVLNIPIVADTTDPIGANDGILLYEGATLSLLEQTVTQDSGETDWIKADSISLKTQCELLSVDRRTEAGLLYTSSEVQDGDVLCAPSEVSFTAQGVTSGLVDGDMSMASIYDTTDIYPDEICVLTNGDIVMGSTNGNMSMKVVNSQHVTLVPETDYEIYGRSIKIAEFHNGNYMIAYSAGALENAQSYGYFMILDSSHNIVKSTYRFTTTGRTTVCDIAITNDDKAVISFKDMTSPTTYYYAIYSNTGSTLKNKTDTKALNSSSYTRPLNCMSTMSSGNMVGMYNLGWGIFEFTSAGASVRQVNPGITGLDAIEAININNQLVVLAPASIAVDGLYNNTIVVLSESTLLPVISPIVFSSTDFELRTPHMINVGNVIHILYTKYISSTETHLFYASVTTTGTVLVPGKRIQEDFLLQDGITNLGLNSSDNVISASRNRVARQVYEFQSAPVNGYVVPVPMQDISKVGFVPDFDLSINNDALLGTSDIYIEDNGELVEEKTLEGYEPAVGFRDISWGATNLGKILKLTAQLWKQD